MNKNKIHVVFFALLLLYAGREIDAGVFIGTADCFEDRPCEPRGVVSDPNAEVRPFAITHPPMYDGTGDLLVIDICVLVGSEALIGPTQRAMATWNALVPTVGNCTGCKVWEEGSDVLTTAHAETTILHELGHCPLGLEHPDRNWDAAGDGF